MALDYNPLIRNLLKTPGVQMLKNVASTSPLINLTASLILTAQIYSLLQVYSII